LMARTSKTGWSSLAARNWKARSETGNVLECFCIIEGRVDQILEIPFVKYQSGNPRPLSLSLMAAWAKQSRVIAAKAAPLRVYFIDLLPAPGTSVALQFEQ